MSKAIPNEYVMHDDYFELIVTSNKYGKFAILIDIEDYEKVSKYHWSIGAYGNSKTNRFKLHYATNKNVGLLHRFITGCGKGYVVDHINGNINDNRKSNLRICTISENRKNNPLYHNNKSGYPGVIWYHYTKTPKWLCQIKVNGKIVHIGYFTELEDAIKARKEAERKYYGEYARQDK